MKKSLILIAVLSLCACANDEIIETSDYDAHNYTSYSSYDSCNVCSSSRVVREPVEVIYKNVTYTTVYEPRVHQEVTYTREPYTSCDGYSCR